MRPTGRSPGELAALDPGPTTRASYAPPPWKRIAVILAGPGVNLLIAFVLFWSVLLSGSRPGKVLFEKLDPAVSTVVATTSVMQVEKGAPASAALRPGDRILTADGRAASVSSVRQAIASHRCAGPPASGCSAATPVRLTVRRD